MTPGPVRPDRTLVVDENLPKRLATELNYRGRIAASVSSLGLRGSLDPELLHKLQAQLGDGWILLTADDALPKTTPRRSPRLAAPSQPSTPSARLAGGSTSGGGRSCIGGPTWFTTRSPAPFAAIRSGATACGADASTAGHRSRQLRSCGPLEGRSPRDLAASANRGRINDPSRCLTRGRPTAPPARYCYRLDRAACRSVRIVASSSTNTTLATSSSLLSLPEAVG